MTDQEFATWTRRLFVAFPSLWEWLQAKSPDPMETQRIWRETLRPYTITECINVVDAWSSGKLGRFQAYERDVVHLCVRAVIERDRDRARRQRETAEAARQRRTARVGAMGGIGEMAARTLGRAGVDAMNELIPHHQRMLAGEITPEEYRLEYLEPTLASLDKPTDLRT